MRVWNQIVPEKLALAGLRSSLVSAAQQSAEAASRFLLRLEVMLAYIRGTRTETGLTVEASLLEGEFKKGEAVSKKELSQLALQPYDVCPAWNYTIVPWQVDEGAGQRQAGEIHQLFLRCSSRSGESLRPKSKSTVE